MPAPTDEGYTDRLFEIARSQIPGLEHVNLACGGETTYGMIHAGSCNPDAYSYPEGTQLAEATRFLETHSEDVAFVTIDVGGNDLALCVEQPDPRSCVVPTLQNLRRIVTELRAAGGPDTQILGMNYYSAGLALWITGPDGRVTATQFTDSLLVPFNAALEATFAAADIPTADVAAAFSTTDYTLVIDPRLGEVPLNVLRICQWTWMCSSRDVHPNNEGYHVIARAFAEVLDL